EALRLNELAEACFAADDVPAFLWAQRATLFLELTNEDAAEPAGELALAPPLTALDCYMEAVNAMEDKQWKKALPLLDEVTRRQPDHYWAWYMKGICQNELAQHPESVGSFSVCIALWPQEYWAYFNRAVP